MQHNSLTRSHVSFFFSLSHGTHLFKQPSSHQPPRYFPQWTPPAVPESTSIGHPLLTRILRRAISEKFCHFWLRITDAPITASSTNGYKVSVVCTAHENEPLAVREQFPCKCPVVSLRPTDSPMETTLDSIPLVVYTWTFELSSGIFLAMIFLISHSIPK